MGLGAVIVVIAKDHHATEDYKAASQKRCANPSLTLDQQINCQNEIDNPSYYLPWGYKFIAFPEGITALAILATLGAIVWQTIATRKSAKAAAESAAAAKISANSAKENIDLVISKERGRIFVTVEPFEIDHSWSKPASWPDGVPSR